MALVTAVMPTKEKRRAFRQQSIACFLAQSFQDVELLILEEAAAPATDITPHDRIRYEWIPDNGVTTGEKRNKINAKAETPVIIHWDDDDWYHPQRIAVQVQHLFDSGKQVVGYHDLLYFRTTDRTFWQYKFPGRPPYAPGTSMCYFRAWWDFNRFRPLSTAEDSMYSAEAARAGTLDTRPLDKMIVAIAHDQNTYHIPFGRMPFITATREMFPEEFLTVTHGGEISSKDALQWP